MIDFSITHRQTRYLVDEVFRKLPAKERKLAETKIAAVTGSDLVTAVQPFMFGGKVVHELYFDPAKLLFFTKQEKIGAIVSAFIISFLAKNEPSHQMVTTYRKGIIQYAKHLKYGTEVSAFLGRINTLQNEMFAWDTLEEHLEKSNQLM